MLEQQLGDRLRGKINDDKTYDVSYYAQTYSKADYGTTQVAVLAPNGDHPKTEKALGRRWTKGFFFFFLQCHRQSYVLKEFMEIIFPVDLRENKVHSIRADF